MAPILEWVEIVKCIELLK